MLPKRILPVLLLTLLLPLFSNAQTAPSDTAFVDEREKLFIHTDRDVYTSGEKIWFRGYLENQSYNSAAPVSAYIYVELYADTLVSRVKIRNAPGEGYSGFIQLGDRIDPGSYILRGYTRNMENYPRDEMFHKRIEIVSKRAKPVFESAPEAREFDIQFLPESGHMVAYRPSKIAFKAVGSDGFGIRASVLLYNSADSLLGIYETRHRGMGLINILSADPRGYYAIVRDSAGVTKRLNLPAVESAGATIALTRINDRFSVKAEISSGYAARVNGGKGGNNVYLEIKNSSETLYKKQILNEFSQQSLTETIHLAQMPAGVNSIQIVTENGIILAERLFFTHRKFKSSVSVKPYSLFDISESNPQETVYKPRDLVQLRIAVKDTAGRPVPADFSVSVTDSALAPYNVNRNNILSHLELCSELKGEIEDPGYYFNNQTQESERYLDLLMMTQGWRCHTVSTGESGREYSMKISGSVSGLFRKEAKRTYLMVFCPEIQLTNAFYLDQLSKFTMEGIHFPDSSKFLFGVAGRQGGQLYGVNIEKEKFPAFSFTNKRAPKLTDKTLFVAAAKEQTSISGEFMERKLEEAVIVAPEKTILKPRYNPSPFLESFSRGQLKEREELQNYDQMQVQDYLIIAYPNLHIESDSQGNRRIISPRNVSMSGPGEPLLYVDGLKWDNTSLLDQYRMTIEEIENVAFLSGTAGALYNTVGGVILISSRKTGKIIEKNAPNVARVTPLGYQKSVKFYAPAYDNQLKRNNPLKDLRTTLYWSPSVKTDAEGIAKFEFYTTDRSGKMNIDIQGITGSGEPVISKYSIDVKRSE